MSPDFQRDVRCVLGLPFDVVTEAQAEGLIRNAIRDRKRCFLSTPNLNFVTGCLSDAEFRSSVLASDLSIADGWPIIAVARLLGIPLPERVAGSSLFERIRRASLPAVSVYLFGGPAGAAKAACEQLNRIESGVTCLGFDSPGFGSVEQMSSAETLARINAAAADFVVVALGAKKGQAWIRRNLGRIEAPVISHLGAVVNFTALTLARAPVWMQRIGLEWAWRIKEEPELWRRYATDGLVLCSLLARHVLPNALYALFRRPGRRATASARAHLSVTPAGTTVDLEGAWTHANLAPLRAAFSAGNVSGKPLVIDLARVTYLDSAAIGLLVLLYGAHESSGLEWRIKAASPQARRLLRWACAEYVLQERGAQKRSTPPA